MSPQTDRDALKAILDAELEVQGHAILGLGYFLAGAAVQAGWRPPARVITDPAAADQLPAGALVITDAGVVAQRYDGMGGWWQVLDGDPIDNSAELIGTGSIEVLRIPPENGDTDE